MSKKYKILAIAGKAGSGKDTLLREVCNSEVPINEIISYTTRPIREREEDGVNYHFVSSAEFLDMVFKNKMLEDSNFNGWWYGTSIDALRTDMVNVGVFNPEGIRSLLKCPDVDVYAVYVRAADKIRLMRQLNREEDPNCHEIARRFLADDKDFDNLDFEYKILYNETLADLAVNIERLLDIVEMWQREDKID